MRSPRDSYWTPPVLTRILLHHEPDVRGAVVWEPCAGAGRMSSVLRDSGGCTVVSTDIHPMHPDVSEGDALAHTVPPGVEWVVTNPPYNIDNAFAIAQRMRREGLKLALLVRLSWLEPTIKRGAWLAANPPSAVIITPRHAFERGDGQAQRGTDSVTTAWCVWGGTPLGTIISPRGEVS
jgi:hypothetical protein